MLNKDSFDKNKLKKSEDFFKTVKMSQYQFKIFLDFVKIFRQHIPISDLAVKGIGWQAIREWQQKHHRELIGLEHEDHMERVHAITQILKNYVKKDLFEKLIDSNDEPKVDKVLDKIIEFYDKTYADR
ncbi:MAG TPA: hypothetical protein VGB37_06135 [Candidatus Lokiarchaeia archaeon]